jgi:hypothetical protein
VIQAGQGTLAVVVAAALVGANPALAGADGAEVTLEAGSEYDSNVHHTEVVDATTDPVVASPLVRFGGRLRRAWRSGQNRRAALAAVVAAKLFAEAEGGSENVTALALDGTYDVGLPARRAVVTARGSYYDAFGVDALGEGPNTARTFAVADGGGALTLAGPGSHRVSAHGGWRHFRYKPDHDFDWNGPTYGLRYATALWRDEADGEADATSVDVVASYRLERRGFQGGAFDNGCAEGTPVEPACFVPTGLSRIDLLHAAAAEITYTGDRMYSGRYEVQVNDSNSFGQSLVRHRFELTLTSELPAEIFATAKLIIQYNTFLDELLLARDVSALTFVSIEDENRNALVLHAARDVTATWTVEARYALFTNEFATEEVKFRRQTGYLGLIYRFAR